MLLQGLRSSYTLSLDDEITFLRKHLAGIFLLDIFFQNWSTFALQSVMPPKMWFLSSRVKLCLLRFS